jgi:hypothetical protein
VWSVKISRRVVCVSLRCDTPATATVGEQVEGRLWFIIAFAVELIWDLQFTAVEIAFTLASGCIQRVVASAGFIAFTLAVGIQREVWLACP